MSTTGDFQDILMFGDTLRSPDMRHEVPVRLLDPIIYIERDGRRTVFAEHLDVPLLKDLEDVDVLPFDELQAPGEAWDALSWDESYARLVARACQARAVRSARTPTRLPLTVADTLAAQGITVRADEQYFVQRRRIKTEYEIAGIKRALVAAQAGWDAIRDMLREGDGVTSEELQRRVLCEIAAYDVVPNDVIIVPHGPQSAIGHAGGSGVVRTGEPVIADLIMRDRATGAYADVTRTFCVGDVPAELNEYFELCKEALEAAVAAVAPGTLAEELNSIVSDIFEGAGYPTIRQSQSGASMNRGFYHALGHGVGLQVHEPPLLGAGAKIPLIEGEVLAIEPALYRIGSGGCRLEDMVLVTSEGCEMLSHYEYALAP